MSCDLYPQVPIGMLELRAAGWFARRRHAGPGSTTPAEMEDRCGACCVFGRGSLGKINRGVYHLSWVAAICLSPMWPIMQGWDWDQGIGDGVAPGAWVFGTLLPDGGEYQ